MRFLLLLVILLVGHSSFAEQNPMSAEAKRLHLEGWDMRLCRDIPASRYQVPAVESERVPVAFLNDTGTSVLPAYSNLKGEVKFLKKERLAASKWNDRTLIGSYYLWFGMPERRCLGISMVKYEWSTDIQKVSEIALPM